MIDNISKVALLALLIKKLSYEEIINAFEILEITKDETLGLIRQHNNFLLYEKDFSENILDDMKRTRHQDNFLPPPT